MNDNLIERYVHEVGVHLPKRNRADVQLELRSSLQDALAARGLDANKAEDAAGVAALLREFGHPEEFAARYAGEQHLIGPAAFPAFKLSYSIAAIVISAIFALGLVIQLSREGFDAVALAGFLGNYAETMLLNFGIVAFVFYLLEGFKVIKPAKPDTNWDPGKLPAVKDPDRINRTELLVGMFFTLVALLVFNFAPEWIGVIGWHDGGFGVVPVLTDAFLAYVPWLSGLWLGELAIKALLYRRGRWTRGLRLAEFGLSLASVAVLYIIVQNVAIVQIGIIDAIVKLAVGIALVVAVIEAAGQLYRLLTRYRQPSNSLLMERK
jgi:hypothetical protein